MGQSLRRHFESRGHSVEVLTRSGPGGWDGKTLGPWAERLDGANVVINLAGRSVNCRYNAANLNEMLTSRVDSTRILGEAIGQCKLPPKLWINSSTATIYAHRFDAANDDHTGILGSENDPMPPKWRASVHIAKEWERSLFEADTPKTRKVAIRSAMVMSAVPGSIFTVLAGLAKKGILGRHGSGKQYVSWIHETDFCRAIDWIIERVEVEGTINLASPNPLPQHEFAAIVRRVMGVKVGFPASNWMLEIGALVLKTETELILKSRRVVPSRLLEMGFEFEFATWESAAEDLARQIR